VVPDAFRRVSTTVNQDPTEITVVISPINKIHEKLQDIKLLSKLFTKQRSFLIYPLKMGSLLKISTLLLSIDKDILDKNNLLDSNYKAVQQHSKTLCKIIAIAIHNRKSDPPAALVNLIMQQFAPSAILSVLMVVLKAMDVSSFMSCIISIRGLNILEMNPQSQPESSIAPGMSLEP